MWAHSWKKVSLWVLLMSFSSVSTSAVDRVSIRAKADSVGHDVSFFRIYPCLQDEESLFDLSN